MMVDTRTAQQPRRQLEKHHRGRCVTWSLQTDGGFSCRGCGAFFGDNPPSGRVEIGHRAHCWGDVEHQGQPCASCAQLIAIRVDPGVAAPPAAATLAGAVSNAIAEAWITSGNPSRSIETTPGRKLDFTNGLRTITDARDLQVLARREDVRLDVKPEHVDFLPGWLSEAGEVRAEVSVAGYRIEHHEGSWHLAKETEAAAASPEQTDTSRAAPADDAASSAWTLPAFATETQPRRGAGRPDKGVAR